MDDNIRKLNTRIRNKETELNELFTKIQKLEEIATLRHKKLISKTGVLGVIFEVGEEEEKE